jgi:hypothetical protein
MNYFRPTACHVFTSLLTVLLLSLGVVCSGTSEANVLKQQHYYFEALKNKNDGAAAAELADDYVGVYSGGIINREHEVADLKNFARVLSDYSVSGEKVSFPNRKTAIVTFKLHVKVVVAGEVFLEDDNVACVWTLQNKKWRLSSQAAVKIKNDN